MGEVDQPALVVPDVLAVNDHIVARGYRHTPADIDVVRHEDGLRRACQSDDETLMRTRWPAVVGEEPRDRAFRGHLDAGAVLGEGALDRGVACNGRAAARGDKSGEGDDAEIYDRGTLSPARFMRFSTSATPPISGSAGGLETNAVSAGDPPIDEERDRGATQSREQVAIQPTATRQRSCQLRVR
jgi:hypothetical protein